MNVRLKQDQKVKVLNSEDIYPIMQQVLLREDKIRRSQEHFWAVGLDANNKILFIELVSLGASNFAQVKPREVFRVAIYKSAVQMILVHNHPSGELTPSAEDKDLTDRLLKSGDLLGIDVIEHLIISDSHYLSFVDEGIMHELSQSGMYELVEREREELRQFKIDVEKERAAKDRSIEIAKKMKQDGVDLAMIQKYTGLDWEEIENS